MAPWWKFEYQNRIQRRQMISCSTYSDQKTINFKVWSGGELELSVHAMVNPEVMSHGEWGKIVLKVTHPESPIKNFRPKWSLVLLYLLIFMVDVTIRKKPQSVQRILKESCSLDFELHISPRQSEQCQGWNSWSVMGGHRWRFFCTFFKIRQNRFLDAKCKHQNRIQRRKMIHFDVFRSKIIDFKVRSAEAGIVSVRAIVNRGVMFTETGHFCAEVTPEGLNSLFQTWMVFADTLLSILMVRSTLRSWAKMWKVRGPDRDWKFEKSQSLSWKLKCHGRSPWRIFCIFFESSQNRSLVKV